MYYQTHYLSDLVVVPADPRICVKVLRITGDCVTTGSCSTTGITFQTGYTITEVCSPPIYDICDYVM
jgi:hypothetical protein